MSKEKVLVALSSFGPHDPDPLEEFQKKGFEIIKNPFGRKLTGNEVMDLAKDCVGILSGLEPLTAPVLKALPNLRVISRCGIGLDNIDIDHSNQKNIQILITPEAPIVSVTEMTIGLILDMTRKISWADRRIRNQEWTRLQGRQLKGSTVGVVGLGRIGKHVAAALKTFETEVIATDPKPDRAWAKAHEVRILNFHDLLSSSDIVTLHLSMSHQTKPILGYEELKLMKKGSYLVNMSRGGVVDEGALHEILKNGPLRGAALDVFDKEPYSGPLTELDNIVLTAHMGSHTGEARKQMEMESANNLLKALMKEVKV